ncbi:hypothetical protein HGRIS_000773 [Hohenbuehelia grisea]|uniref:DUF5648 domain-containing protein n=1 Tax=Hohenbuehelia grisea TaxID=104357 RepID=A0ABR3IPP4_9AGAR
MSSPGPRQIKCLAKPSRVLLPSPTKGVCCIKSGRLGLHLSNQRLLFLPELLSLPYFLQLAFIFSHAHFHSINPASVMKFSFFFSVAAAVLYASQVMSLPAGPGELEERTIKHPAPSAPYRPATPPQAPPAPPANVHKPPPHVNQNCARAGEAAFLLRGFSMHARDHFYTTNAHEMQTATTTGYTKESHAAKVFTKAQTNTIPLHRLYNGHHHVNDHFYTTSEHEANNAATKLGYTREGVAAHIYGTQICGSVPLHRLYNPHMRNHFYTIAEHEANNAARHLGYLREGVAGFVLPPM